MKSKLENLWLRFDNWYWLSGTKDIMDLISIGIRFIILVTIPGTLMIGGMKVLGELWGSGHPFTTIFWMVGIYVALRGAADIVKSGI